MNWWDRYKAWCRSGGSERIAPCLEGGTGGEPLVARDDPRAEKAGEIRKRTVDRRKLINLDLPAPFDEGEVYWALRRDESIVQHPSFDRREDQRLDD